MIPSRAAVAPEQEAGMETPGTGPLSAAEPRSLFAWLPYLWSRVLFPGKSPAASPVRWRSLLLLLVLPGALLYPCLSFRLFEPDEGRYAEIPREMLVRGEWVVPYLQAEPYLDKPPLLYWLVMGSYGVFGVSESSARLIPALALHACIVLTYLLGRRSVGERGAFWGALALSLAPGFISMGRLLVLDGLLALWVVLAWLAAFEAVRSERLRWGWWLLAAGACGLGILTKGPVALVLLVPPLWAHRRLTGRTGGVGWRGLLAFAAVALAVSLPWYVALCVRVPAFAWYFFWQHNVVRFLAPFDHLRPVWFYAPILLCGLLPATLLAWPFLRFLLSGDPSVVHRRSPELGFLLLAGGWCVLFFTLSGCKLPTYILPAFPPLALALGYYVGQSRWRQSRWPAVMVGVGVALLGLAHYLVIPWYARFHSPLARPEQVLAYCGDSDTPVVCYPRSCDSVGFYLARDDLRTFRGKETPWMILYFQQRPRSVILFTHRHSMEALRHVLPPDLRITGETPLYGSLKCGAAGLNSVLGTEGLCYMAVIERRPAGP
jgi:hypothetical protein